MLLSLLKQAKQHTWMQCLSNVAAGKGAAILVPSLTVMCRLGLEVCKVCTIF